MSRLFKYILPGILALSLMIVYITSMAPGLTWANYGADGGDLIAAAATGGNAHPTGYPFYLLLARIFQFIPIGSLAFRTNMMSALAAASASVLVSGIVVRTLPIPDKTQLWVSGLVSGFAFGLAPLIWSQAVITEVYTLHSFFVALLLFLLIDPLSEKYSKRKQDVLVGLVFGLAMGNHLTTIFLLPVIFLSSFYRKPILSQQSPGLLEWQLNRTSILRRLIWSGVGLLIYMTIPLRALFHPPVNWGNPITLKGFFWLVSGRLYQAQLLNLSMASLFHRILSTVSLLLKQFGIIGICIGLIGLIIFFKPTRLFFITLWIAAVSSSFAVIYATTDAFILLIPAFLCFAIWIGIGTGGLIQLSSKRFHRIGEIIGLLLIIVFMVQAWYNRPQVDASQDLRAESFGKSVLALAPSNALVFTEGDEAVFSLWYFQYALHGRPDIIILATDLLPFEWYQQTLRATYPDLNLPIPSPFSQTVVVANPERPVCYVQYIQVPEINCLPIRKNP